MSTRRNLLASAVCAMGAGTMLPLAAKAVGPHPDADLLALCSQLASLQAEWQCLWGLTTADGSKVEADRALEAYSHDVWSGLGASQCDIGTLCDGDLPRQLYYHRATTPDGLRAKAAAILALDDAANWCDVRGDTFDLMRSLICDAAGDGYQPLGGTAVLTAAPLASTHPHPDADLLTACGAFNAIEAEVQRINAKECADDNYENDEMNIAIVAWYGALEVVSEIPARTLVGVKAKAAIAHTIFARALKDDQAPPEQSREEFFALSALSEMVGIIT
jgi:hypothetical protein